MKDKATPYVLSIFKGNITDEERIEYVGRYGHLARGIYRHYKGGNYYVSGLAIREEDVAVMVIYHNRKGIPFVRTLENFYEEVDGNEGLFRFVRV